MEVLCRIPAGKRLDRTIDIPGVPGFRGADGMIRVFSSEPSGSGGFVPGGGSLHNCMAGHGPDQASFVTNSTADLKPFYWDLGLAFIQACDEIGSSREMSLAKTNAEMAVMWSVKHVTK